jgi:hypothetical protein
MSLRGRQGPRRGPFVALREFRSAQHEGTPVSTPGRPKCDTESRSTKVRK